MQQYAYTLAQTHTYIHICILYMYIDVSLGSYSSRLYYSSAPIKIDTLRKEKNC